MKEAVIRLENIRVVYDKGQPSEMVALDDVSLEIYPEEYIIFFGPSGCGKSTLLYTIAGLETPENGVAKVFGDDLRTMAPEQIVEFHRQKMGMVFQAFYLIPTLTVLDNVVLPQMFRHETPAARRVRGMEVLKRFEIAHLADRLPTELSGGQQQRVAICRSVINDPPLIFADEPVGNLDSKSSDRVMDLLFELNTKDKKTVILVTHDPRFLHYAHRVFYLKDGKLVREVKNEERKQFREEKTQPFVAHALAEFARFYPHLEETALKAKFLTHYLMDVEDEIVQERVENLVRDYFSGKLSRDQFERSANQPYQSGGAGLYIQTAAHVASELGLLVTESNVLHRLFKKYPNSYEVHRRIMQHVRAVMVAGYKGTFTAEQSHRLDSIIQARLEGSLDHREARRLMQQPTKEGGVGLRRQTVELFSTRLELLLIEYPPLPGTAVSSVHDFLSEAHALATVPALGPGAPQLAFPLPHDVPAVAAPPSPVSHV